MHSPIHHWLAYYIAWPTLFSHLQDVAFITFATSLASLTSSTLLRSKVLFCPFVPTHWCRYYYNILLYFQIFMNHFFPSYTLSLCFCLVYILTDPSTCHLSQPRDFCCISAESKQVSTAAALSSRSWWLLLVALVQGPLSICSVVVHKITLLETKEFQFAVILVWHETRIRQRCLL